MTSQSRRLVAYLAAGTSAAVALAVSLADGAAWSDLPPLLLGALAGAALVWAVSVGWRDRLAMAEAVCENVTDYISIADAEGRVIQQSPSVARQLGHAAEERVGLSALDLVHPEDLPEARRALEIVLRKPGGAFSFRHRVRSQDGSWRVLDSHLKNLLHAPAVRGIVISSRDVTDQVRAEVRQATQLAVTRALNEATGIAEASPPILEAICRCAGWDLGEVWCADGTGDVLRWKGSWHLPGVNGSAFDAVSRETSFARGQGLPGRVWECGTPAWLVDVAEDPEFVRRTAAKSEGLHGALAFPVGKGAAPGVLVFFSHELKEPDLALLDVMAEAGMKIGQFVESKRTEQALRETEARYLTVLYAVGAAVASPSDVGQVCQSIVREVATTLSYGAAAILLVDREREELFEIAYYGYGLQRPNARLRLGEGLSSRVVVTEEVQVTPDVTLEPAYVSGVPGCHSEVDIPIKLRGEVIGVLVVEDVRVNAYTPEDVSLLTVVAQQTATAIDNARLHEQVKARRIEEQAGLLRLSQALLGETDVQALLGLAAHSAAETLGAEFAAVALLDADGQQIAGAAGVGWPADMLEQLQSKSGPPAPALLHAVRTRTPVVVPDAARETRLEIPDWVKRLGLGSGLIVPMLVGEKAIGGLVVNHRTAHAWDDDEMRLLSLIASTAAQAIERARLLEAERAMRERAETLREAARIVGGSLELDEVLRLILDQLKRVLVYETASVLLLGEVGSPDLVAGIGYADEKRTSRASEDLLGSSPILRQMARELRPVIIADVREHPGWIWVPGAEHVRSFLAVPIVAHGQMTGALMVDHTRTGFFTEADAGVAQALAQHMAVAIENARLFEALRQSEARHRSLVESARDVIFTLSPDGAVTSLNPAFETMTGWSRAEWLGQSFAQLIHPDDLPFALETSQRLLRGQAPALYELRIRSKRGEYVISELTITPQVRDGSVAGVLGIARDITERKRAEVREDAHFAVTRILAEAPGLRQAVPAILEAICRGMEWDVGELWLVDAEGRCLTWYDSWYPPDHDMPGFESASRSIRFARGEGLPGRVWVKGAPAWRLDVTEDPDFLRKPFARQAGLHGAVGFPVRGSSAMNGVMVFLSVRVREPEEAVLRTMEDIGRQVGQLIERKRAEEEEERLQREVRRSALEWRLTFDAIESPILMVDPEGRVVRLNRSAQEGAGKSYEEILGGPVEAIQPRQPWCAAAALAREVVEARAAKTVHVKDDATGRTWDLAAASVGDGRSILSLREVTHLVRLQESVQRAEAMAMLGSLVSTVAHEVRNPLFGMSVNIDALSLLLHDRQDVRELLEALCRERDRTVKLMDDLLHYGRPASSRRVPGQLEGALAAAVAACGPVASRFGVDVRRAGDASGLELLLDSTRLEEVFENLLENACQHSPRGGVVTLGVDIRRDGGEPHARCDVRDQGPGFSPDILTRVFEPFFTGRKGGVGLGLAIVKRIVEEHGGHVLATNAPDGGAEVIIDLPLLASASARRTE